MGDKIDYKLPPFKDPDGNDDVVLFLNNIEDQDFPPFINFTNATTTLHLKPNNLLYQGRTYYFTVNLKEKNSDFMISVYYITVKIIGDIVDPEDLKPPNKTEVAMNITSLNYKS